MPEEKLNIFREYDFIKLSNKDMIKRYNARNCRKKV